MILAVTGGKGGVGKSTVAYNLGAALDRATSRDRAATHNSPAARNSAATRDGAAGRGRTVVVDADLGMADLPTARGPDLHDVLAGRADPVEAVREDGPVALLPCGRSLAGARAADPRKLVWAVEEVAREYGRCVLDCPAGLGSDVGLSLLVAEAALVVTTPSAVALADAIRARALARELDAGLVAVALNRAGMEPPVARTREAFGAPVVTIPDTATIERAMSAGQPASSENTEAFDDLAALVQSSLSA